MQAELSPLSGLAGGLALPGHGARGQGLEGVRRGGPSPGAPGTPVRPLSLLHAFPFSIHKLRENVYQEHQSLKEKELQTGPKASHGYGGKFGVEQDRMDKVSGGRGACGDCQPAWQRRPSDPLATFSFESIS